jgi:hypothetical protein
MWGRTTSGTPWASAPRTVPEPPWQTTKEQDGSRSSWGMNRWAVMFAPASSIRLGSPSDGHHYVNVQVDKAGHDNVE